MAAQLDAALKKDISDYYFDDYLKQVKSEKTGFFKKLADANDWLEAKIDKLTHNSVSTPGLTLLASVAASALFPPVGLPLLAAWAADAVLSIVDMVRDANKARDRVEADIDNGKLPEAFGAVIDQRITALGEKIELYKTQKSQLPLKGDAAAAFEAAKTPETPAVQAPKPENKPTYYPSIH